jgi:hypothetical protein
MSKIVKETTFPFARTQASDGDWMRTHPYSRSASPPLNLTKIALGGGVHGERLVLECILQPPAQQNIGPISLEAKVSVSLRAC